MFVINVSNVSTMSAFWVLSGQSLNAALGTVIPVEAKLCCMVLQTLLRI